MSKWETGCCLWIALALVLGVLFTVWDALWRVAS